MLALTPQAATAIRTLTSQPDMSGQTGIRIFKTAQDGPDTLGLAVTPAPLPEDQVIESEGARVFVEQEAAEMLDDQLLDAQVTKQGQVQFQLLDQQSPG